jgi:hypothetical protein
MFADIFNHCQGQAVVEQFLDFLLEYDFVKKLLNGKNLTVESPNTFSGTLH